MNPNSSYIRCCTNYYLKENECLECMPGYRGENCSESCPYGYFGRLCNKQCNCSPDSYCEPTRGCLCNTTSVNCTILEQAVTETITSDAQDTQAKHYLNETLSSLVVIVCFIVGSVYIRYINVQKRKKELHSTSKVTDFNARPQFPEVKENNVTSSDVYNHLNLRAQCLNMSLYHSGTADTCRDPLPCSRGQPTSTSHPNEESIHISWYQFDTACKNNKKGFGRTSKHSTQMIEINDRKTDTGEHTHFSSRKYGNMVKYGMVSNQNQRQQKFCDGSAIFELKQSDNNTVPHENKPKNDNAASTVWAHNQDLYVNYEDIGYANCFCRPESPSDSEGSDVYFDVSYEGQLTLSAFTDNSSCLQIPVSSESGHEMSDYFNCGLII